MAGAGFGPPRFYLAPLRRRGQARKLAIFEL